MPERPQNLRNAILTDMLNANTYWHDKRYSYSGSNVIYAAYNTVHKEATSATTWYILKYTYDGSSNIVRVEGPLKGSWDGKTELAWGT